jgi:hypothetical protein
MGGVNARRRRFDDAYRQKLLVELFERAKRSLTTRFGASVPFFTRRSMRGDDYAGQSGILARAVKQRGRMRRR